MIGEPEQRQKEHATHGPGTGPGDGDLLDGESGQCRLELNDVPKKSETRLQSLKTDNEDSTTLGMTTETDSDSSSNSSGTHNEKLTGEIQDQEGDSDGDNCTKQAGKTKENLDQHDYESNYNNCQSPATAGPCPKDNDTSLILDEDDTDRSFEALEKCIEWLSYHPGESTEPPDVSHKKEMTKRELVGYRQVAVRQWVETLPERLHSNSKMTGNNESESESASASNYPNLQELRRLQSIQCLAKKDNESNGITITPGNNTVEKTNFETEIENKLKKISESHEAKTKTLPKTTQSLTKLQIPQNKNLATIKQFKLNQVLQSKNSKSKLKRLGLTESEQQTLFQDLLQNPIPISGHQVEVEHFEDDDHVIKKSATKKSKIRNFAECLSRMPILGKCWEKHLMSKGDPNQSQKVLTACNLNDPAVSPIGTGVSDPNSNYLIDDINAKPKDNDESDANVNIPLERRSEDPNPFLTIDIEGKDNETVRKELNSIIRNMRIAGNTGNMTLSEENDYSDKNSDSNGTESDLDEEISSMNNTMNDPQGKNRKSKLEASGSGQGQGQRTRNNLNRKRNKATAKNSVPVTVRATESNSEEIQRLTNFLLNTRKSTMRTIFSLRKERIPPETPAPPTLLNRVGRHVTGFFTNTIHGYFRAGTSGLMKRAHRINPLSSNDLRTVSTTSTTSSSLQPQPVNRLLESLQQQSVVDTATRNSRGSLLKKLLGFRKHVADSNSNTTAHSSRTAATAGNSATVPITAVPTSSTTREPVDENIPHPSTSRAPTSAVLEHSSSNFPDHDSLIIHQADGVDSSNNNKNVP